MLLDQRAQPGRPDREEAQRDHRERPGRLALMVPREQPAPLVRKDQLAPKALPALPVRRVPRGRRAQTALLAQQDRLALRADKVCRESLAPLDRRDLKEHKA